MKLLSVVACIVVLLAGCLFACSSGSGEPDGADGGADAEVDAGGDDGGLDAGGDSGGDPADDDGLVLAGCVLLPADNMWNTPIDTADLHPLSDDYIAAIRGATELHPDFGSFWQGAPLGIPWTSVPAEQRMVAVGFLYDDESDPGPYPIPPDAPIEGGADSDGDRHVLVIQRETCLLYEMFDSWPQADGSWQAGSGAIWRLDRNEERPRGWTSADAAGLAILPGLVRWEEVHEGGEIRHAMRVTLSKVQAAYIPPATHSDGVCGMDPSCPPMGLRLRLKASFDDSGLHPTLQVFTRAMKKYGLVVADTGGDMYVSGTHDPRWDDEVLHDFHTLTASDFEAVYTGDAIPY